MLWGKNTNLSFHEATTRHQVETAESRAVDLLSRLAPKETYSLYCHTGQIYAVGHITGNTYVIRRNETVVALDGFGNGISSFCIHNYANPPTDTVLSLWMLITGHETHFIKTANRSRSSIVDHCVLPAIEDRGIQLIHRIPHVSPESRAAIQRADTERKSRNRKLAYHISPTDGELMGLRLDVWDIPCPARTHENRYYTRGVGYLCMYPKRVAFQKYVTHLVGDKPVKIPMVKFDSTKDLDDAVLQCILSGYSQIRVSRETKIGSRLAHHQTAHMSKCIMSTKTRDMLRSEMISNSWKSMKVILDDRLGELIFCLPDAPYLGTILFATDGNNHTHYGVCLLEPHNVMVYRYWKGKVTPENAESAIELIYGQFPDRNSAAMNYDIASYQINLPVVQPIVAQINKYTVRCSGDFL